MKALKSDCSPEENPGVDELTRLLLRPTVRSAMTIEAYSRGLGELNLATLVDTLRQQAQAATAGDWRLSEATLVSQASTLDAIFNTLAQRAADATSVEAMERLLKLALRAQGQCRATIETLAEIKSPLAGAYVRQANIAAGHQQVNNGEPWVAPGPRAQENGSEQTQLLEPSHGERVDTRAARSAGGTDPELEPVGEIHGAQDA